MPYAEKNYYFEEGRKFASLKNPEIDWRKSVSTFTKAWRNSKWHGVLQIKRHKPVSSCAECKLLSKKIMSAKTLRQMNFWKNKRSLHHLDVKAERKGYYDARENARKKPGDYMCLIIDGMERGIGISIFTILLSGLVAGIEASGILNRIVDATSRRITSKRGVEMWMFSTVSAAVLLTTHSVVALLSVGGYARRIGEKFGLDKYRRANILDLTVCTYPFIVPYCIPTVLASSTTISGAAAGLPHLAPLQIGLVNFHSWALLLVTLLAIATGYGRSSPCPTARAPGE